MILEPWMVDESVSWIHISDPLNDLPWSSIGNCLPGKWMARKTDLGLEVCHEDYLETNPREWISSERDVGIDSEILMVSYDYTTSWFRNKVISCVTEEWGGKEDYAFMPIENGYYNIFMKTNEDKKVTGIWVEAIQDA